MSCYIRPDVKTTDTILRTLKEIEPHSDDVILDVTSGLRDPADQLVIIAKYAIANGVRFIEFDAKNIHDKVMVEDHVLCSMLSAPCPMPLYSWQRTWSRELSLGIIINPPLAALCLEDYQHPTKGLVKAGTLVQGSPHYGGKAFDISGRPGIEKIVGILATAKLAGAGIKDWLIERNNNAVHVDCV